MGRPRKPTSLKILDGDRKDRIEVDAPTSPPGLGAPPSWLDDFGREAWAELDARLTEMGVATRADHSAALLYCVNFSRWRLANEEIAVDGLTTRSGLTDRVNPAVNVANEAQRMMFRVLSQFGMTPSSRAGLHVTRRPQEDELLAYMAGKPTGTEGKGKR